MTPFVRAYLECALWSSSDGSDSGEPLDRDWTISDFAPEAIEAARLDCDAFQERAGDLLNGLTADRAGHLFWLNRNGHGTGFWDEYSLPESVRDALSALAESFRNVDPYVGDPQTGGGSRLIYFA